AGGDWQVEYPDYLGCVNSLDLALGRLRAELGKLGMAENTLLLLTSDHGCHFRTRNAEYKRSCHDGCIRVPMVACGPGFAGGKVASELVSLIDVAPTILTAGGVEPPKTMRGRPLQQLIGGTASNWPKEVFLQISESHCGRAVRTARWKYSVRSPQETGRDAGSGVYVEDFLYDLAADPHERNNLIAEPPLSAVRAELAATLKRRMLAAGEAEPTVLPAGQSSAHR
ncbi:MAG: sulfatase/phosphatase domain-containing protein, partial [Planctomycetota bacterium]